MKLLITGGAGFIGSAVVRAVVSKGINVINLDALTYASCLESLDSVSDKSNYQFVNADIRNRKELDLILLKYQPDAIMHLAAESHVDRSIDGPGELIDTNIVGTFNLLESARKYWRNRARQKKFCFHHVSTDEVYGSLGAEGRFTENSSYSPNNPYSASKVI